MNLRLNIYIFKKNCTILWPVWIKLQIFVESLRKKTSNFDNSMKKTGTFKILGKSIILWYSIMFVITVPVGCHESNASATDSTCHVNQCIRSPATAPTNHESERCRPAIITTPTGGAHATDNHIRIYTTISS
jgi:hypothetical protein